MPPLFTKIHELEPARVEWAIMVRVVRSYSLHVSDDPKKIYAMECVFHDEEGGRIHATIKKPLISRFSNMFLEEHIYTIKNFVVTENRKKMRTTSAPYRLIFIGRTVATEVLGAQFPRNMYDFQKYDVLGSIHEDQLVDVIGRLSSRGTRQVRDVQGRKTSMLDITLENLEGDILPCTIWGLYADELDGFIETTEGCIVIIMQLCKVRTFRGEVSIYNTFHVSKVIFDQLGKEIEEFRNSLILTGRVGTPVRNVSLSNASTLEEELELSRDRIITLDQLKAMQMIGDYWCYCKIVAVEPMTQWFYVSCKKCIRKMTAAGCMFYCAECDNLDPVGVLRYKVHVRVVDCKGMGTASLILWDKECNFLFGMTASALRAVTFGEDIPEVIMRVVGFEGLFKVQIRDLSLSNNLGPIPVTKLTTDMNLIHKYCGDGGVADSAVTSLKGVSVGECCEGSGSGDNEGKGIDEGWVPLQPDNAGSVPNAACLGVKRCLMEEFVEDDGTIKASKVPKTDDA